jgi:hypothetical protein
MKEFVCKFFGKRVGAIGISSPYEVCVTAEDKQKARLACYDTHEHIWGGLDGIYTKESEKMI